MRNQQGKSSGMPGACQRAHEGEMEHSDFSDLSELSSEDDGDDFSGASELDSEGQIKDEGEEAFEELSSSADS